MTYSFGWVKQEHHEGTKRIESVFDPVKRLVSAPRSIRWTRRSPILDQGSLGSCTGNALASWRATDNIKGHGQDNITEWLAVSLYGLITKVDDIPGSYPPSDTGSSTPAVGDAGVHKGYFKNYLSGTSLSGLIKGLQKGPVVVGTDWKSDMMETKNSWGLVTYTGSTVGGHEILCVGVNINVKHLYFANSWGPKWGNQGYFTMRFSDVNRMFNDNADTMIPVL